jgi:hypothetical protein
MKRTIDESVAYAGGIRAGSTNKAIMKIIMLLTAVEQSSNTGFMQSFFAVIGYIFILLLPRQNRCGQGQDSG